MPTMRELRLEELAIAGLGASGMAESGVDIGGAGLDYEAPLMRCTRCRTIYVLDERFPHVH